MSIKQMVFIIFNSIFLVLGLTVLGVGIYSRVEDGYFKDIVSGDELLQAPNILIAAGVLVALIGFLGCFGAWKKNAACLIAYATLVFLIFILEVAAGIYGYTQRENLEEELETGVHGAITTSYGKSDIGSKALTKAIDWLQQNIKCCGSDTPSDWEGSEWYFSLPQNTTVVVPSSCCVNVTTGCNEGKNATSLGNKIYTTGCIGQGRKFVKDHVRVIGGIGIGFGVVQILGVVCAILLCREFGQYDIL